MSDKRFRNVYWIWAIGIAGLFAWINREGQVITHDSLFYLEGAQNLLNGQGFSNVIAGELRPDTHYGPIYALCIAGITWLSGMSPLSAAQLLMAVLLVINLLLFYSLLLLFELKNGQKYLLLFMLPFLPPFWMIHTHLWSEALYLAFLLAGLRFTLTDLPHWRWYIVAGIMGLAVLVRFSGLFMLPLFGLWLLQTTAPKTLALKRVLIFSVIALLPFLGWTWRNEWVGGELSSRTVVWNWAGAVNFSDAAATLLLWLGLIVPIFIGLVIFARRLQLNVIHGLWVLYPVIYVGFLVLAKSTIDPKIPLDNRLLSAVLPLYFLFLGALWSGKQIRPWHNVFWIIAVLLTMLQFMRPAGQLWKQELGLRHQLNKPPLDVVWVKLAQLPPTDTLYASGYDYTYLNHLLPNPIVYYREAGDKNSPFYYVRLLEAGDSAIFPRHWIVENVVDNHFWRINPAGYP